MKKMPFIEKIPALRFAPLAPLVWSELEKLQRSGWLKREIKNPESVAEHIISLREIGYTYSNLSTQDRNDLIDMLEVHDWPEAIHGDEIIVTQDVEDKKRRKAIKFEKEHKALIEICNNIAGYGDSILNLWLRFETSDDHVAALGRQIDKYQAIEKALEYERTQGVLAFQDFLEYSRNDIHDPALLKRIQNLEAEFEILKGIK